MRKSPGDSGMGSPSSRGEHTPASEDQRPVGEGAALGVADCLLAACSASAPANQNIRVVLYVFTMTSFQLY